MLTCCRIGCRIATTAVCVGGCSVREPAPPPDTARPRPQVLIDDRPPALGAVVCAHVLDSGGRPVAGAYVRARARGTAPRLTVDTMGNTTARDGTICVSLIGAHPARTAADSAALRSDPNTVVAQAVHVIAELRPRAADSPQPMWFGRRTVLAADTVDTVLPFVHFPPHTARRVDVVLRLGGPRP